MAKLKCGLIQMGLKGDVAMGPEKIRDRMIEAHLPLIDQAGTSGVQVLCFQEIFTQPYFCPSQDAKWCDIAEPIPCREMFSQTCAGLLKSPFAAR